MTYINDISANKSGVYNIITQKQYNYFIKNNKVAVVEYSVPWCPPCVTMKSTYDMASLKLSSNDIKFANVSLVDSTRRDIAAGVSGTPTVNIYRYGTKVDTLVGNTNYVKLAEHIKAAVF